jgi:hypothetical protein
MGRPLHKKYFGNRNIGTTGTADDGIGGTAVASVTLGTLGSYTVTPVATFSAPDLANVGGVTATGTVTSEVLSATISGGAAGSGGYTAGNILTVTGASGTATFTVATVSAGGVATVTPLDRGSFTGTLATGARATTVAVGAGSTTGTGCTLVLTYRAKAVVITEQGSGYDHATDAAVTFTESVTGTSVMITDTGTIGTTGNQENAINMTAFLTGGSAVEVDIIKQVSTRRYKVTDGTRTGIVALTSTLADAAGECSIQATDASAGTYFVTKLTKYNATLTRGTGTVYAEGASVPWTFGTATATVCKIANT